jgi:hypothetical protein
MSVFAEDYLVKKTFLGYAYNPHVSTSDMYLHFWAPHASKELLAAEKKSSLSQNTRSELQNFVPKNLTNLKKII